jgi:hypothetical protein
MTDMEALHYLYNQPERGPGSFGCLIDRCLRSNGVPSLRWSNHAEISFALAFATNNMFALNFDEIALRLINMRRAGKFDDGLIISPMGDLGAA